MDGRRTERRRATKGTPCMPRLRGHRSQAATPVSLLERLRDVVFKLIMLTAVSKGVRVHRERRQSPGVTRAHHHHHPDSYQSQAVEDCIEFFKRSSAEGAKSSNVSEDAADVSFAAVPIV